MQNFGSISSAPPDISPFKEEEEKSHESKTVCVNAAVDHEESREETRQYMFLPAATQTSPETYTKTSTNNTKQTTQTAPETYTNTSTINTILTLSTVVDEGPGAETPGQEQPKGTTPRSRSNSSGREARGSSYSNKSQVRIDELEGELEAHVLAANTAAEEQRRAAHELEAQRRAAHELEAQVFAANTAAEEQRRPAEAQGLAAEQHLMRIRDLEARLMRTSRPVQPETLLAEVEPDVTDDVPARIRTERRRRRTRGWSRATRLCRV